MDHQAKNRIAERVPRAEFWDAMYEAARQYFLQNGNLNVPAAYVTPEGDRLGAWLIRQRDIRSGKRRGTLSEEQIQKLDAIGMSWQDLAEERWNRNYEAVLAYYAHHGNLDVPQSYVTPDGLRLGLFVKNLRFLRDTKYRKWLTPSRVIELTEMGMIWDLGAYRWQQNYQAARAHFQEHGKLPFSKRYVTPDGVKLGLWLAYQREKYAKGDLSKERIELLNALNMIW